MKFAVIDYSHVYFRILKKTAIPSVRKGKFIQIRNDYTEYVVCAPEELSVYHANIVERFCLLNKIEGNYNSKKKDYFEIKNPEWDVAGGGMWQIDEDRRVLCLSGFSQAYGAFVEAGLKERICSISEYSNYEVNIAKDIY